jgi:hypothetical protein
MLLLENTKRNLIAGITDSALRGLWPNTKVEGMDYTEKDDKLSIIN